MNDLEVMQLSPVNRWLNFRMRRCLEAPEAERRSQSSIYLCTLGDKCEPLAWSMNAIASLFREGGTGGSTVFYPIHRADVSQKNFKKQLTNVRYFQTHLMVSFVNFKEEFTSTVLKIRTEATFSTKDSITIPRFSFRTLCI